MLQVLCLALKAQFHFHMRAVKPLVEAANEAVE